MPCTWMQASNHESVPVDNPFKARCSEIQFIFQIGTNHVSQNDCAISHGPPMSHVFCILQVTPLISMVFAMGLASLMFVCVIVVTVHIRASPQDVGKPSFSVSSPHCYWSSTQHCERLALALWEETKHSYGTPYPILV